MGRRSSVESHLSDSSSGEQATRLSSLENVTFIACDFGYSLALCGDGSLRSWGKNDYAQVCSSYLLETITGVTSRYIMLSDASPRLHNVLKPLHQNIICYLVLLNLFLSLCF